MAVKVRGLKGMCSGASLVCCIISEADAYRGRHGSSRPLALLMQHSSSVRHYLLPLNMPFTAALCSSFLNLGKSFTKTVVVVTTVITGGRQSSHKSNGPHAQRATAVAKYIRVLVCIISEGTV